MMALILMDPQEDGKFAMNFYTENLQNLSYIDTQKFVCWRCQVPQKIHQEPWGLSLLRASGGFIPSEENQSGTMVPTITFTLATVTSTPI